MSNLYEIRANYDRYTVVVYQAYRSNIAKPAIETGTFQSPFSFRRMTWIKPSFLWLMARSNWGTRSGQENILGIRITRVGWDYALSEGVLTSPDNQAHWEQRFAQANVHIQWDPERSIRGAKLNHRSIQVGISRHLIHEYVNDWIVDIEDYTPLVRKIHALCRKGDWKNASRLLPTERVYPTTDSLPTID